MPTLPTFIIPGAAKAGTTTLHYCLSQHPEILMSKAKEPNVFEYRKENRIDLKPYDSMFDDYSGEKAIGEASVNYMVKPESVGAIYEHIPDVKLIFSLRDPVKRAVSHYWHRINAGMISESLEEVISKGREAFPIYYGLYSTHIRRFLQFFPRENIFINILEEMNRNWDESFMRIFRFIGVDDSFKVVRGEKRNSASRRRSLAFHRSVEIMRRGHGYKRYIFRPIRETGKKLSEKMLEWNLKPFQTPPTDPDIERRLAEFFIPEIEGLEELMGRQITAWTTRQVLRTS
ncbi:MAG TPA: hypothetical protein ENF16_07445 [Bacteroidetes bacterium]|nr:hypothetical protein [Bacteroidota bacterium]